MALWHVTAAAAAVAPIPDGRGSAELLRHGSLEVRWYAPKGAVRQGAHDRDEVYVVVHGSGVFMRGGERVTFGPGDLLFVAAKTEHRFEYFSADLATWVVFFGPVGGERDGAST
jgi:mannose-6-phosphate isomerase-like protein (cupin superfamily)